ncbi:hypothetical protein LBMAG01_02150 [Acidobacteriota bacterium]|nr:hypothetical protein LBMAG01_02150 [Acidobacteriota bacterium]
MTINQLSNLAKLLEDASKPNSQSREVKQSPKPVKSSVKTNKKPQIVQEEEKQASLKAEKKTHKYLKRVTSSSSATVVKPSSPPVVATQISKLVPTALGTSLIQALAKGVVKSETPNDEDPREPWQSKFQGKQY